MSLAELLLWPAANNWGASRRAGKPIHTADAWIASTALQWRIPLVTTDFRD